MAVRHWISVFLLAGITPFGTAFAGQSSAAEAHNAWTVNQDRGTGPQMSSTSSREYIQPALRSEAGDLEHILPARPTEAEKRLTPQQREALERGRDPEIYGFTDPPSEPIRRFGEFEQVEDFIIAYSGAPTYDPIYGDMIEATFDQANVRILVKPPVISKLTTLLEERGVPLDAVELITDIPFNSVWMRDYGPQAVLSAAGTSYIDTRYYPSRVEDDGVPTLLANVDGVPVYRPDLFEEGGNFFSNGHGVCFTTNYLLEQNDATEDEVAAILQDYFGCVQSHFLQQLDGNVIGHIDMFFHVVDEHTLLLGEYTPEQDAVNAEILEESYDYLSNITALDGEPFNIVRVPMPNHLEDKVPVGVLPVVRTYMNLVTVNGVVLVPVYRQEPTKEAVALSILQTVFPDREIVPIPSDAIAPSYGAIHCITQTTPAGRF